MSDEHIENISRDEIPLLYDIIHSAIKETNANYFEIIGVLNLITSELLDDLKMAGEENNPGDYDCDDKDEKD